MKKLDKTVIVKWLTMLILLVVAIQLCAHAQVKEVDSDGAKPACLLLSANPAHATLASETTAKAANLLPTNILAVKNFLTLKGGIRMFCPCCASDPERDCDSGCKEACNSLL